MTISTINPATGELLKTFTSLSNEEISAKINLAQQSFEKYRHTSFQQRSHLLKSCADILEQGKADFAKLITLEMGKTYKSAVTEIEKCSLVCNYYAENGAEFLSDKTVQTDANQSFVRYQPLGVVLAVMPWNFPFWQVFRFAAPALMAGNVALLKHASNVPQCALAIEEIFHKAGFTNGVFQTLLISASQVSPLMADQRVKAATLTGSEPAGISLAAASAMNIKKTVMELGGSDPFIVLSSANLKAAAVAGTISRMLSNGESCIAAKRFIVIDSIADEFEKLLIEEFQALKIGDPMVPETDIGPLATNKILEDIDQKVQQAINAGAKLILGGKPMQNNSGNYYPPTLIIDITPENPVAREEFFGPVGMLFRVPDIDTAIQLANDTPFGLGASAWTNDRQEQQCLINEIEAGAVFINGIVKSDPRMPFGGVKRSGYGRELSVEGIHEFVNVKTVWVKQIS